jgi:hypothetical protein
MFINEWPTAGPMDEALGLDLDCRLRLGILAALAIDFVEEHRRQTRYRWLSAVIGEI